MPRSLATLDVFPRLSQEPVRKPTKQECETMSLTYCKVMPLIHSYPRKFLKAASVRFSHTLEGTEESDFTHLPSAFA